jgi:OOP family OmpA-OmpF porin
MSKQIVSVSLAAMLAACASVPEVDTQASSSNKLGVVQVGTKQNAELIFCEHEKCPQRTPKRLPPPPPPAPVVAKPLPVKEEPKQVHFKVHFRWGWSRLDADGRKEAEAVVASGLLKDAKRIEIAGRTDPTGPRKFNEKLAVRRAETVKAVLVMAGIPADRIAAVAQTPCCDGDLAASKAAMRELRRTDIEITVTTK